MRFRIDLKIFLFIILFYFTKQIEIYAMIMFFAILHELGHLTARVTVRNETRKIGNYAIWNIYFFSINTKRL